LSDRNRNEPESVEDDSIAFDLTLASLRQRILRLTCTIIARDHLAASSAKQDVVTAIDRIQRCVARIPEGPARDDAERRLSSVLAIADQIIACAPTPSPAVDRTDSTVDAHPPEPRPDVRSSSDTGASGVPGAADEVGDLSPGTFDPAEALQNLHGQVIQLEAMTHAASEAVTRLPFPEGREDRRIFDRIYTLVTKVADETEALVRYGDELISALAAYLQRRRAGPGGAPVERS
jgi:hypothetical protein